MASASNATNTMSISQADIYMVAERAVTQLMDGLRGELGVKFHELENGEQGLQVLHSKLGELEEELGNLSDNVTTSFKQNNGLLRNEIKAAKGDIVTEIEIKIKVAKQIEELERNINTTLFTNSSSSQRKMMVSNY